MKFTSFIVAASLLAAPALADTLAYDTVYDNASGSLATVACSDGTHGLLTRGFNVFGDLPTFPRIGSAAAIAGYNSPNCGSCWQLTWTDGQGAQHVEVMTAIDHAQTGFVTSLSALNTLTDGQGTALGRVDVTAVQVPASQCGL